METTYVLRQPSLASTMHVLGFNGTNSTAVNGTIDEYPPTIASSMSLFFIVLTSGAWAIVFLAGAIYWVFVQCVKKPRKARQDDARTDAVALVNIIPPTPPEQLVVIPGVAVDGTAEPEQEHPVDGMLHPNAQRSGLTPNPPRDTSEQADDGMLRPPRPPPYSADTPSAAGQGK